MIDIRRIIGGLLVVYGVIVGTVGVFDSPAEVHKAEGVRINLWAGIGMTVIGSVFLAWSAARPLVQPQRRRPPGDTPVEGDGAPSPEENAGPAPAAGENAGPAPTVGENAGPAPTAGENAGPAPAPDGRA